MNKTHTHVLKTKLRTVTVIVTEKPDVIEFHIDADPKGDPKAKLPEDAGELWDFLRGVIVPWDVDPRPNLMINHLGERALVCAPPVEP
jgi:hypothetical protein